MTDTHDPASPGDGPRYGRFLRRVQAAFIDAIVIMVAMFGAVFIAVTLNSDHLARTLGFSIAIGWLLYEPLLVALAGSTVGHYLCNLRVVDNRTGGNLNFFKAVVRTVLKAVLGWLSFVTMAATRRHQAIHDLATTSTVQIRNLAHARPHHYRAEQTDLAGVPSRGRRLAVTGLYLIAVTAVFLLASPAFESMGLLSAACFNDPDRCTRREDTVFALYSLCWIAAVALCIALGWRGRLIGARASRPASPQQA